MTGHHEQHGIPTWVKVCAVVVAVGIGVIAAVAVLYARYDRNDRERNAQLEARQRQVLCERSVQGRDDNRAMWLWLFDQFPDEDVVRLGRVELDQRIPRLECVGGLPQSILGD